MSRKDRLIKEIEYLYDNGLVTSEYYTEVVGKISDQIILKEEEITSLTQKLNRWESMSYSERMMYVIKNVSKIIVDMVNKEIVSVEFK